MKERYYASLGEAMLDAERGFGKMGSVPSRALSRSHAPADHLGSVDQGSYRYEEMGPPSPTTTTIETDRSDYEAAEAEYDRQQAAAKAAGNSLEPTNKQQLINYAVIGIVLALVVWTLLSAKAKEAVEA